MRWGWVNFQCRGVLLIWIRVGQGPTAFAVGADGGCWDIFSLVYRGWSGGAKVLCYFPGPGRPTYLYESRARAYCACSRYG